MGEGGGGHTHLPEPFCIMGPSRLGGWELLTVGP